MPHCRILDHGDPGMMAQFIAIIAAAVARER